MTDYTELVKALRCETSNGGDCWEKKCQYLVCGSYAYCNKKRIMIDAAAAIEELQAEVDEAKQHNTGLLNMKEITEDEMLEYIRTTPVGPLEPMLIEQLHKQGKWVEDTTTYAGPGLSNYKCSLCGKICGTWRRGLKPSELPNWCGNCGADMRAKMEVQDGKRCD